MRKKHRPKPLPDFPEPPSPPQRAYHVLTETAIPLQAASKLVGWVAAGVAERLEHVIRTESAEIKALLQQQRRRR